MRQQISTTTYRAIFDSMDEGFCILELIFDNDQKPVDFRYIDINAVFEKQTGMKGVLGKTVRELVPNIEPFWVEKYGNVCLTGESVKFEDCAVSMGKWFNVNAFRIGNPEDKLIAVLFNDITERKRAENAIKLSQERQDFLLRLSDELRELIDPVEIQERTCRLLGEYFRANRVVYCENHGSEFVIQHDYVNGLPSMVGHYPVEVFGPENFMAYFRRGEAYVVNDVATEETLTENEKSAYLSADMFSFIGVGLIKKGQLQASFGVHTSIPRNWTVEEVELTQAVAERTWSAVERAKAEEALKESEIRFRTMAEASGILISHSNALGNAIYFNNEWREITGRSMQELLETGWVDLLHPEDRDEFLLAYNNATEKRDILKREFRVLSASGEYRWLLSVVSPRFSPNGGYAGQISSCIDITEMKRAEEELEYKNQELVKINNDLDNFIYTASHDLKAPISNIEGLMKVLVKNLPQEIRDAETIKKVTSMIEVSINRFKNTILDLTEISKVQKQYGENTAIIDLETLIEEVKLDLETEIVKVGAEIHTDLDDCKEVNFSEKNLRSIIYNLISNAIKYHSSERTPRIDISCKKLNEYYLIEVKDNGLGIDPAQHEKIFSMFKRIHNHVEGSGIGLYIVKKIIENSGGKIEVKSEVGKGATFKVYMKI
jgi:PAS domain S-box-containing protein